MDAELTLGERLFALRMAKGMTQQQVADALRTSVSNVSNWEIDYSEPKSLKTVRKLCSLFAASADYILGTTPYSLTADEIKLVNDYDRLDDDGQHTVRAVLDSQLALHSRVKADP